MQIQMILHMHKVISRPSIHGLDSYILYYPKILLVDSGVPDQTAQMCILILAYAVCIC